MSLSLLHNAVYLFRVVVVGWGERPGLPISQVSGAAGEGGVRRRGVDEKLFQLGKSLGQLFKKKNNKSWTILGFSAVKAGEVALL